MRASRTAQASDHAIAHVAAGYVMTQGQIGATGFLAGVRTERTDTESSGWVRARTGSTAAQQQADPVGSAQRDYANTRREIEGGYTKSFPSVHLNHDLNRNLKARLSWSTSFGRPPLSNLLPNETVNEPNQTLTINNPSLLPQTATNWDASLEYYFEPVGVISASWFHKEIKDYIINGVNAGTVGTGPDNGFNGEYPGFTLLTRANAGTAVVQGWEFTYQQQFTFLPGLLKGLSASANYTLLETRGDFGGTTKRSTGEVPGFIPRSQGKIVTLAGLLAFTASLHAQAPLPGTARLTLQGDPSAPMIGGIDRFLEAETVRAAGAPLAGADLPEALRCAESERGAVTCARRERPRWRGGLASTRWRGRSAWSAAWSVSRSGRSPSLRPRAKRFSGRR